MPDPNGGPYQAQAYVFLMRFPRFVKEYEKALRGEHVCVNERCPLIRAVEEANDQANT